jgi:hypothetical protein
MKTNAPTLQFESNCTVEQHSPSTAEQVFKALRDSWPKALRWQQFLPWVSWTDKGPLLGFGTNLAKRVDGNESRLLALLSVTFEKSFSSSVLDGLRLAEAAWKEGHFSKSATHIALLNLPRLTDQERARRLHMAAGILDEALLSPRDLLKACEMDASALEALEKYNPDQPRIPAGNLGGGQWTFGESGVGEIHPPRSVKPKGISPASNQTALIFPDGCEEEWKEARKICLDLLSSPNPPRGLTGGYRDIEGCAKGFVSMRCGGNPV